MTLPDYPAALAQALQSAAPLGETERVQVDATDGRVLAETIAADRDLPPFDRAQLDGYAVRAAEVGRVEAFKVAATVPAGSAADADVPPGHCAAIATGAPVPAGLDAVIGHEQSDRGDPVRFSVEALEAGHAVHPRGADARAGRALVPPGTLLGPQHVGLAASVGLTELVVARRPRVAVLTSGDEVLPAGAAIADHQIRNSNAAMLAALIARLGAEPAGHRHVADEPGPTADAVAAALAAADVLLTVGGISAGERDYFPGALDGRGVKLSLRGAAIQPGKPVLAGRAPGGTVVIGLPGNPVSALACACLFVWPVLRVLLGLDAGLPWRPVRLAAPVRPNPKRRAFRPAVLTSPDAARVPAWAGSGDLAHTAPTAGLLELPPQAHELAAGALLPFLDWPGR